MPATTKTRARPHPKQTRPVCWACGVTAPKRVRLHRFGWASRRIVLGGAPTTEFYCAPCFAEWGWPEATDPAPAGEGQGDQR